MSLGKAAAIDPATVEKSRLLQQLRKTRERFINYQKENRFVYKTPLVFTGKELEPQKNKAFYQYEQLLLKLLLELDGITVPESLREKRKQIVTEIQDELHLLDKYKLSPPKEQNWTVFLLLVLIAFVLALYSSGLL
ncbi:hypothetical protein EDD86DRAFT_244955 [Gorgonomyces haynaldii]|nr:hypothetical protein EDD86DRAFT_244955 [Gorgonomyces haynaldii]